MSDEDKTPMVLQSEGWENLPDGRQQLLLTCNTAVDYATMPKTLLIGKEEFHKYGWDSDRKIAFYRTGLIEDLTGPAEEKE